MNSLFDPALVEAVKRRIMGLRPESERAWGTMPLTAVLAHCTLGLKMANGIIKPQRAALPVRVIGLLIKPLVVRGDRPIRRNSPSMPELLTEKPPLSDFEPQRACLIAAIDGFASGGSSCCTSHPHPFFGPLTPDEWAVLMYKHIDHHLRQFGA